MAEVYDRDEEDGQTGKVVSYKNPEAYQRKKMREIERAQRYFREWERKGETIVRLYRKQQSEAQASKRKFAMLWANVQVMMPTLYGRVPEPVIGRRYKDKDVPGRLASEILERAAAYIFDKSDFDATMRGARDDCLLPGRGTAWVRYIADGQIAIDYVHWRDYLHEPARRWEEVTWVAHRSYMTKDAIRERFTKLTPEQLKEMKPDNVPKSGIGEEEKKALEGKYTVWEIWDKAKGNVCFISPTAKVPLEEGPPFLELDGFWPTPRPIWSTTTTDSTIPVPDYKYFQDQAEEIDDLTRRIGALTDGLKLVGFYPKGSEAVTEIENALLPTTENKMIGVESWAAFSEKGGIKSIVFLPIEEVVATIQACVELRRQLIQDVYEITGISDIMRGATNPNETLGAQQLKAQTGSVRIRDRQQDIQRFARDILRIVCEIVAEKFSPGVLMQMTNVKQVALDTLQQEAPKQAQPPGPPPGPNMGGPPANSPMAPPMSPGMPPQQAGAMPIAPPAGPPQMPPGMEQSMPPMQALGAPPMMPPGLPMQPPNGAIMPPGMPQQPPGPPPQDQMAMQSLMEAFQLLKDDRTRGFRVDIETDSTVQPDEDAEKQRRIEYTQALGSIFKEAVPMVQQVPKLLPLVGETLRFVTRGFRAGKQLEDVLDKTLKSLEEEAANPAPPKPSKEDIDKQRLEEVDKPAAAAEAGLKQAQARRLHAEADAIPAEVALKQDQMILGDAQKSEALEASVEGQQADRDMQGEQFEATQSADADQFAATQAADQQASQAQAMGGGGAVGPAKGGGAMQGAVAQLLQQLALSTQQNSQAIQGLAQVMASPTVVDTPRGRYVARKAMQ